MTKKASTPALRFKGFTYTWEQRRLGEVLSLIKDGTHGTHQDVEDGPLLLSAKNIKHGEIRWDNTDRRIAQADYEKIHSTFSLENGDILLTIVGSIGEVAILRNSDGITFQRSVAFLRPNKELKSEFLYAEVLSEHFQKELDNRKSTSAQPGIYLGDLGEIPFTFPKDIAEQKQIGAYFRNLDRLITLHQRKYDKLTNMKKSMLEKMFPKNGANVPEIRFKGFTDAWEQRKLGEAVQEVTRNDATSDAPIMMITANNGFIEQSERYAFNNAGESLKKYILLEKGELAYNHGASKLRPYGSCFTLTTSENARIPFVYHCFSADEQNSEFLSIELNGADVENQLRRIVSSGARMDGLLNISFQEYVSVSVLLPTIEEQNKIADFFKNLDNLITLHQRELEKLKNLKKACLEKMFV